MKKHHPRIALVQMKYFDIHNFHNLEKIKRYIALASKKKADIICFPEACVHKTKTLNLNGKFLMSIREECRKKKIWCIITENFMLKKKNYNMAVLIDREGKIIGHYKKIHLYGESSGTLPGKRIKVFNTDFARIGIVICWDFAFPKLFKQMKKAGAQIVFCPAQWAYEEKAHDKEHKKREKEILESLLLSRAFENGFFVAICNPVRTYREDQVSYSAISSPHKILKEIFDKEGLIVADINLKEIERYHKIYPK